MSGKRDRRRGAQVPHEEASTREHFEQVGDAVRHDREADKVASKSVVVTGAVAEWEGWTEMALPQSGVYVVSGALVPIEIDRERNEGVYVEPNVWMVHPPPPPRATKRQAARGFGNVSRRGRQ